MENPKMKRKKKYAYLLQKDIPDDLLVEIVSKLPARSICRFRCVCKTWCDLFQDKEFINKTRAKPPFEFEIQKHRYLEYYEIDERGSAIAKGKNHYIGGCKYRRCNNLICYQRDTTTLSVLDLSIQRTYALPLPPFELEQPCFNFEFGLDPCSKAYKVLVWTDGTKSPDFYIITLLGEREGRSSSWRRPLGVRISNFSSSYEKSFATTTGKIYLVDGPVLISFNLATEDFRIILLPYQVFQRSRTQSEFWYSLFEYEGCLCWVEQSVIPIKPIGCKYWEITGMWMLTDHVDLQWVRLMKEIALPMPMYASSVSTTWSQKHSQFSSTRSGEIMVTISSTEFGEDPYILLYSFLDCEFKTIEISINRDDEGDESCEDEGDESCEDEGDESCEDGGNESCRELL